MGVKDRGIVEQVESGVDVTSPSTQTLGPDKDNKHTPTPQSQPSVGVHSSSVASHNQDKFSQRTTDLQTKDTGFGE